MPFRSVHLSLLFEEAHSADTCTSYAIGFCEREKAGLTAYLAVPLMAILSGRIIPLVRALTDEVNAERHNNALEAERRIETAARLAGIIAETHIVQNIWVEARNRLVAAARLADVIILPKSAEFFSLERDLIEAMIFTSGRPVILVPANWTGTGSNQRIIVAWDGSARAARAVGDAMPLLAKAEKVEIVCVTSEASKAIAGADLAAHLSRHCRGVTLTELQLEHADAARALQDHAGNVKADLLVMGAFAHARVLQMVLGGVTSTMLDEAELPIFFSY
jgi:nucleotide-binding universal stress UspA family protein